jgi:hypothetical protein
MVIISLVNRSFQEHQKLWKTIKHSERTFISADSRGYKRVHIFSWNWTHTVSATQANSSKWIQVLYIHSNNQWIPNWKRKITHTHTHTHTHSADILFLNKWANFLTSIYWITSLNRGEVTEAQDSLVHSSIPKIRMRSYYGCYTHSYAYASTHTHTHPCPRSMRRHKRNSWNPGVSWMCGYFHVSK